MNDDSGQEFSQEQQLNNKALNFLCHSRSGRSVNLYWRCQGWFIDWEQSTALELERTFRVSFCLCNSISLSLQDFLKTNVCVYGFFCLFWVCDFFRSDWPWTCYPPASTSQVLGIPRDWQDLGGGGHLTEGLQQIFTITLFSNINHQGLVFVD